VSAVLFQIPAVMLGVFHASLLGPNIFLSTLLSNTLSLSSSLNIKDHVSHLYKTTGKIIVVRFNLYDFRRHTGKQNSEPNGS